VDVAAVERHVVHHPEHPDRDRGELGVGDVLDRPTDRDGIRRHGRAHHRAPGSLRYSAVISGQTSTVKSSL
jgi:hypothetical protein